MSQVFVVLYGIQLFSQKKIDLRMQNSEQEKYLYPLVFTQGALENHVCKKGQVNVTLFPGMVFQERIFF